MSSICVIPAKGTSKRLPGKNIKPFLGKPVIEYTITAALMSGCFADIVVSTDDEDTIDIAIKNGVGWYKRDEVTCGDSVPMVDAVIEVLDAMPTYDYVCMAYACFIRSAPINGEQA